mgnify:CR=1 FL=1
MIIFADFCASNQFRFVSGENNASYKNGVHVGRKSPDPEVRRLANKKRRSTPEYKVYSIQYEKKRIRPPDYKEWKKKYDAKRTAKKKLERQGEGTLDKFLK